VDPNATPYTGDDERLVRLRAWWVEAKQARQPHEDRRRQCLRYFQGQQLDAKMEQALLRRGQPKTVLNEIRPTVNVLTGMFRAQKLDWTCDPVGPADEQPAELKQKLLKHYHSASQLEYVEPQVADEMAQGGVGYVLVEPNESGQGLRCRRLDPAFVYVDPHAQEYDLNQDCQYFHISKWLELRRAKLLYPKVAEQLDALVLRRDIEDPEQSGTATDPKVVRHDPFGPDAPWNTWGDFVNAERKWVRIVETWYAEYELAWFWVFGAQEQEMVGAKTIEAAAKLLEEPQIDAILMGAATLKQRVVRRVKRAIWTGDLMIEDGSNPHDTDVYPMVRWGGYPTFGGGWQGIIDDLIDPQDVINKSFSKSTWHRMANQLIAEKGAFPGGIQKARDEINKPDGVIEVAQGGLDKFRVDRGDAAIAAEMGVLQFAADRIRGISGINEQMRGENGKAESRVAIDAKREQAYTMQGVLFDHRTWSWVILGETMLAMSPKYLTGEYAFQVTEEDGTKGWVTLNKQVFDPQLGMVIIENSVAAGRVNVKVTEAPLSDTERERLGEMLSKALQQLPPPMAAALMHLPFELSKLPRHYKEEIRQVVDQYRASMGLGGQPGMPPGAAPGGPGPMPGMPPGAGPPMAPPGGPGPMPMMQGGPPGVMPGGM
jgi:hypothetical protein